MAARAAAQPQAPAAPTQRKLGLSFNPGLMRSDITFYADMSDQTAQSPTGSLMTSTMWKPVATSRAYAAIVKGVEFFQLLQAGHRVDARFKLRWLQFNLPDGKKTTPTTSMRITWNNNVYLIKSVDDPDDLHIELQIDGEMVGKETDIL